MIINVTQKDIDLYQTTHNCPVNNSLERRFPKENIDVGHQFVWINKHKIELSERVSNLIMKFDLTLKMNPFKFTLNI